VRVERRSQPEAERHDLTGLVRQVALADGLVLAVVLLQQLVATRGGVSLPLGVAAACFAALGVALRFAPWRAGSPAIRLELETWGMAVFIAVVTWHTGGADSVLQSLYVLPVVLGALVLPGARLVVLLASIVVADATIGAVRPGFAAAGSLLAGRLLAALGPLAIIGWLVSELGSALLMARRRAASLTEHDALTGLASRESFLEGLQQALGPAAECGRPCAVLVLDLDGSRRLNEQIGYEAGNAALRLVAGALRGALRATDIAARWGGDEFAVLLPGADLAAAQLAAQRVRNAVNATTFEVAARHLRCAVSIGVAAAPRDGRDAAALLCMAERRLGQERELRRAPGGAADAG
jgi:diguanylate cyclase (GGDEF)-like protein